MFNCTGYFHWFHWLVNNRLLERAVDHVTNLKIHRLLIPAEPKNDEVSIKCLIYNNIQNEL